MLSSCNQFKDKGLTGDQKRILAYAHAHGQRFTSSNFQKVAGLDIYGASSSIKDLIRKGIVRSTGKGSRVYEALEPLKAVPEMPEDLVRLLPVLNIKRAITNKDIREALNMSRQTATRLASELCKLGWLERTGKAKWMRYHLSQRLMTQPHGDSTKRGDES